jgi:hypothetical protein
LNNTAQAISNGRQAVFTNEPLSIAGVNTTACPLSDLFANPVGNDVAKITFKLAFPGVRGSPWPDAYANADNGRVLITPTASVTHVAELIAVDSGGNEIVMAAWNMAVRDRPQFELAARSNTSQGCLAYVRHLNNTAQAISNGRQAVFTNEPLSIAGVNTTVCSLSDLFANPAGNDVAKISFKLTFTPAASNSRSSSSSPWPDTYVSATGRVSITPLAEGNFITPLVAVDGGGNEAEVSAWNMTVIDRDDLKLTPDCGESMRARLQRYANDAIRLQGRHNLGSIFVVSEFLNSGTGDGARDIECDIESTFEHIQRGMVSYELVVADSVTDQPSSTRSGLTPL